MLARFSIPEYRHYLQGSEARNGNTSDTYCGALIIGVPLDRYDGSEDTTSTKHAERSNAAPRGLHHVVPGNIHATVRDRVVHGFRHSLGECVTRKGQHHGEYHSFHTIKSKACTRI